MSRKTCRFCDGMIINYGYPDGRNSCPCTEPTNPAGPGFEVEWIRMEQPAEAAAKELEALADDFDGPKFAGLPWAKEELIQALRDRADDLRGTAETEGGAA